ncbi:MAG: glycine--tRNA ligase subunit beta [Gaiellaceae bacterium]
MSTLLFEIGCEELPASACREAEEQLPALCLEHLGSETARLYIGPRRLAVVVEDVSGEAAPEWVKGPPVALREKAAAGFAKRYGVTADELEERDGFLGVEVPGKSLAERLAAILDALAFSKSMQWEAGGLRFARPVRWLCARLDETVVLGDGTSFGHRFTSGRIEIPSAQSYAETMRANGVEPDAAERRRQILEGLPEGWRDPLAKLEEVVYLVESVAVLEGAFDDRFLALPPRVIETAMQSHQRYFPLAGARFAFVANGGDPALVIRGNERVLEGRLDDATFTFERDLAVGIEQLAARLGSITFFQGAGSFADKAERLVRLVDRLGGGDATREAARLSKADQASELVREFPDLEGHIGAEYARAAGYPEAVCVAIDEQYLPDGADAPLPSTEAGRLLSAADKIDNLDVAFGLGHKPSGSRDPYGLRRAAIGLCRLAVEGGLTLELDGEVKEFVEERLEGLLDVPVELVRAARASALQDLGGIAALARALNALEPERLEQIVTVYKRSDRIARDAEPGDVDPALFQEDAERAVFDVLERAREPIGAVARRDFDTAFAAAAALAEPLERFFEDVLVMAEDEAVRRNRLRLLLDVRDTLGKLGDLSQLPG